MRRLQYPAGLRLPRHAHGRAMFCYALAGGYREVTARRTLDAGPGTVVYQPGGEPHTDAVTGAGLRGIRVEVTSDSAGRIRHLDRLGPMFIPGRAEWYARALVDEIGRSGPAIPVAIESLALLVLAEAARDRPRRDGLLPPAVARVRDRLREEFADPPSLAELAADVNRHPAHVARAFRQHMACTIGEYLRHTRVGTARQMIETGGQSLAEVAAVCGYADQSHMGRAFRRYFGLTPAACRRPLATPGTTRQSRSRPDS